jgi:hypothetical protein
MNYKMIETGIKNLTIMICGDEKRTYLMNYEILRQITKDNDHVQSDIMYHQQEILIN